MKRGMRPRITPGLLLSWLFLLVPWAPAQGQEVTLVAGGDVNWCLVVKPPEIANDAERRTGPGGGGGGSGRRADGWIPVPYLITPQSRAYLEQTLGAPLETPASHQNAAIQYGLTFASNRDMVQYPFRNIRDLLSQADIAFANLENPLSDDARNPGAFRTPTVFAEGLSWAGVDVVSTANNHALDAEGVGLLDTREALWREGIGAVGTGRDLEDARRPYIIERKGMKVAFLAYSMFTNAGDDGFATPARSGVVPLDPFVIKEDIRRVRDRVDYVVVSFHWSVENSQETLPADRAFAHDVIDAGADVILGHHPHVPRGFEVYQGKPIFYSFGNLIFGHAHDYWMDNYMARLTLTHNGVSKVEVFPVSGRGARLAQPSVLTGPAARTVLEDVKARSAKLDTDVAIVGDIGLVTLSAGRRPSVPPSQR